MATYLLEVIPITKTGSRETLTYYSSKKFGSGTLISVPLRKKQVPALITSEKSAKENKAMIRHSDFSLRRVDGRQSGSSFLLPAFLKASEKTALFHATTQGSVLNALIPNIVIESKSNVELKSTKQSSVQNDISILQTNRDDRISSYRSLIREEFAKKTSVFIIFPTQDDISFFKKELERGIENYIFELHSSLKKKELKENLDKLNEKNHPIVILGTASFLCAARFDTKTIIIERESSRFYKLPSRPYLDTRIFAEHFSRELNARLILSDSFMRIETLERHERGELSEFRSVRFKYQTKAERVLIDMQKQNKKADEFQVLSKELKRLIDIVVEDGSRAAILAPRRGLAPITVCSDCGNVVLCKNCNAPVTLHEKKEQPFFLCHKCGTKRSAEERCLHCNSWNLTPLGIGIDRVEKEIKKHNPKIKIFKIDRDTTPNKRTQKKRVTEFYKNPGSILLGTEMMIGKIKKPLPYSAIVSLDNLLSLPEYSINEKILHIILALESNTLNGFILQTRDPERTVFKSAVEGNLMQFYREEIEDRKALGYPPFSVLIKLSVSGAKNRADKEIENLEDLFKEYGIITFPAFIKRIKNNHIMHGLIKIGRDKWPDKKLVELLRMLPPYIAVNVNPDTIL